MLQSRSAKSKFASYGALCLWAVLALPALAGEGVWTQGLGLENSVVNALAVAPSGSVYAGTLGSGIFKSNFGGSNWAPVNTSFPTGTNTTSIAIDAGGVLYAATQAGAFKSSNAGASWAAINSGLTSTDLNAVAIDAAGNIYVASSGGGVLKTTNGGGNWGTVNEGLVGNYFYSLTFDPLGSLYAGAPGAAFKTGNGGVSWSSVSSGLPNSFVTALVSDSSGNLYAGTKGGGVYKSGNGGALWTAINNGLTSAAVSSLALDRIGNLYAGTSGGVFRTSNGGAAWTALNNGLTTMYVNALAVDPNNTIYAGTIGGGVFQYTPSAVAAPPFSISAAASGGNTALKLIATIKVADADISKTGNLYVVAYLPNGAIYAMSNIGWVPINLSAIQAAATLTLGTHVLTVLDGKVDVSALKGTVFFAGYGVDTNDLLVNKKYAPIYTIP